MLSCKECHSSHVVKNGFVRGAQRYRCKVCSLNFIHGDGRTSPQVAAKKALVVLLYALGKASFNMLGKLLGHSPALIYRWVRDAMDTTEEPLVSGSIQEMEFDELWHFIGSKKTKDGLSKPWIVAQGELLPGLRVIDAATFKRLYDKVKHLEHCHFYTDDWDAFTKILPPEHHTIGKSHTVTIERDNSNTRHHLGRMTRRTKVVSKKEDMLYGSIKLWVALTSPEIFSQYQETFISIFR